MQELEKSLEEIEENKHIIEIFGRGVYFVPLEATKQIIRSRLSRENDFETARSSRDNDGWIPVECKLPKTNGIYDVTRHIDGHFISDSAYFDGQNTWHSDNRVNHSRPCLTDVLAWRPLPEPYRPKQTAVQRPYWRDKMLNTFLGGHK